MTVAEYSALEQDETTEVLRWRFSQLTRSGFPIDDAAVLASHLEVDLHAATDLVARGCPPRLAVAILL